MYTKTMKEWMKIGALTSFALLAFPSLASAQSYVPVEDIKLNPAFSTYSNNFNNYAQNFDQSINTNTDSLRNLIAGGDPGGIAKSACVQMNNAWQAFAYQNPDQAWANAASSSQGSLPLKIPSGGGYVQINESSSLRCLLQELVEWQKLGLSIQIHSLLKTYISDAQTKQLNNQLLNKIAAANLNWAKSGNQTDDNGIMSSQPVYSTNRSQSEYNVKNRQLENITDQAAADPASGNPVGSLGICQPWRLDTTANMVNNNRGQVEDPSNSLDSQPTSCALNNYINPNDYSKFSESFNDPSNIQGGLDTFVSTLNNLGNSPLGASTAADFAAEGRLERQQESTRLEAANSGYTPTKACSGDPSDPYCLDQQNSIAITPAAQNERNVGDLAQQGLQQVQDGNTLDAKAGSTTELQTTDINTKDGLLGYDETGLANSQTVVNKLVQEFYDVISIGYFGLDSNPRLTGGGTPTTDWAQATMLMIYDEMKFNDQNTETVVTNGTAPAPTGY